MTDYKIIFPFRARIKIDSKNNIWTIVPKLYDEYKEWYDYLVSIGCKFEYLEGNNPGFNNGFRFFKDGVEEYRCLGFTDFCDYIELKWGKPSKIWDKCN